MNLPDTMWTATFAALVAGFGVVLLIAREKRFVWYFVWGMALGFLIDTFSVSAGYYQYFLYPAYPRLGFPLTVSIAEGCAVSITIFFFDRFIKPRLS